MMRPTVVDLGAALVRMLDETGAAGLRDEPQLAAVLDDALRAAREAWPGVELADAQFLAAVAERLDPPSLAGLTALRMTDLFGATACARGDARAIERVRNELIAPALRATLAGESGYDDLMQRLTVRFFVGSESAPPRIVQYGGRGSLKGWARVAVLRAVKDLRRGLSRAPKAGSFVDELLADPGGSDPEIDEIRAQCGDEFRAAFAAAVDALPAAERRMLRQHHIAGVTLDQLAKIDGVHRVTAARRLAKARRALLDATKAELATRLRATGRDVESVLRMVGSRLEVSVDRLLATRGE